MLISSKTTLCQGCFQTFGGQCTSLFCDQNSEQNNLVAFELTTNNALLVIYFIYLFIYFGLFVYASFTEKSSICVLLALATGLNTSP